MSSAIVGNKDLVVWNKSMELVDLLDQVQRMLKALIKSIDKKENS